MLRPDGDRSLVILAAGIGAILTLAGWVLWVSFPQHDSYLAAPDVIVTYLLSGGVHGGQKWQHDVFGNPVIFYAICSTVNLFCYGIVAYAVIKTLRRFKGA